ncbi:MAG: ABC transporter ATP-binding protein [Algicola sp.]|nr:ABC transporter ATP-binding protein [Algicola sp.]
MLSVSQLGKSYGDQQALQDVSFELAPGERVALLGANGSGKTTTINSICRLLEWQQGTICFEQQDITKSTDYMRHIGAVLGGCRNVNWRLTASQNAEYFARLHGTSKKQALKTITKLEEQLGLAQYAKREVGKLSTGNKQKAALLSALAHQPKLLLLDEPTLGLDSQTVDELQNIIIEQSNRLNQGFLITSHDMAFIEKICTRVIVLDKGKVIYSGDITALKEQLYHFEMRLTLSQPDNARLNGHLEELWPNHAQLSSEDDQIIVQYDSPEQAFATVNWLAQQAIIPLDLSINPLSVETAYRTLLSREVNP